MSRRRTTVLFDLNGVLIRIKHEHERQSRQGWLPHPFDPRPGLKHLVSLWPQFRLGLFTSVTQQTVERRLAEIEAYLWGDPLFAVRLLLVER